MEHVGEVHRTWTASATQRVSTFEEIDRSDVFYSPRAGDLLAWYGEGLRQLVDVLRNTPEDATFWTWWPPQPNVAFLRRRMAHETAVHRWDCEAAYGDPQGIEAGLAADGIDELLTVYLPRWGAPRGTGERIAFRTTDTADAWVLTIEDEALTTRREAGGAGATVAGPANDVLLALWGRIPFENLTIEGDAAPLRRLLAEADFD